MACMMTTPKTNLCGHNKCIRKYVSLSRRSNISLVSQHKQPEEPSNQTANSTLKGRRQSLSLSLILMVIKISNSSPATKNCVSTSENITDLAHCAPPWNYNPKEGRGSKKPASREQAMEELLQVLIDDVEFWFPPGKKSVVQYRSTSRLGNFDFDINRRRIKALRVALEKKGWASQNSL